MTDLESGEETPAAGETVRILRVFVASPSDVQAERDLMPGVIDRINDTSGEERGVRLILWRWEKQAVPGLGLPQDLINPELDKADAVVVILWNRLGTVGAKGWTGTQEEVLRAVERWTETGRPRVMLYFCQRPASLDDDEALDQRRALLAFQGSLPPALIARYETPDDFKGLVEQHLRKVVAELAPVRRAPRAQAAAREGTADAAGACDLDVYLDHVEATCGFVKLTGLLAEQAAPAVPLSDVYVPLLATRPDLGEAASDSSEQFAERADGLSALRDALGTEDDERVRGLLPSLLAWCGVPPQECERESTLSSLLSRLRALAEPDDAALRDVLTTVELEDAVRLGTHLLIEGDPGSGKTTSLMRVAMRLVQAHADPDSEAAERLGVGDPVPLPVFVALRRFRAWLSEHLRPGVAPSAQHLVTYLVETEGAAGGGSGWLTAALEAGSALILLDGLDEVPDEHHREQIADVVREFTGRYDRCRYVISSRPSGLTGRVPVLLSSYARCRVQGLDAPRRERFVRAWYGALVRDPREADRLATDLLRRIEASGIQELVSTPIMLTAVAVVHQTGGELPERRAELYEHCVKALCGRWDAAKDDLGRTLCGPVPLQDKLGFLEEVARAIHEQGASRPAIERGDLRDLAREHLRVEGATRPEGEVLDELTLGVIERSGLLVSDDGGRTFRFRHQTFQEFLVGRWLCDRAGDVSASLRPHMTDGYWREVIVLAAGHEAASSSRHLRALLEELFGLAREIEEPDSRVAAWAAVGRALADVRRYPVHGLEETVEPVLRELASLVDDRAQPGEIADRILLAETLGRFGDPRLAEEMRWVSVPAGEFHPDEPNLSGQPVAVGGFEIQRWPVTVGEYAPFVDQEGYREERWWELEGWKWRNQKGRLLPARWDDQLAGPRNRPVTGVSCWEAQAFCRWYTARTVASGSKLQVRLPTRMEWEKAARGGIVLMDGESNLRSRRRFPWGDEPSPDLANFIESRINRLIPVGCYPAGRGPYGAWDQAGNIMEWTAEEGRDPSRAMFRAGSYGHSVATFDLRHSCSLHFSGQFLGFRPARSHP